jgi:site-specific recombinase XerD
LLNSGFSLKAVGDHLGHRSLSTTRVYAKVRPCAPCCCCSTARVCA